MSNMKTRANEITTKRTNKSRGNKGQLELSWVAVQNLSSRALEFKLPHTEARSGSGLAPNIEQISYREFGQAQFSSTEVLKRGSNIGPLSLH